MYTPPVPLFPFRYLFNLGFGNKTIRSRVSWKCQSNHKNFFFPRGCYALAASALAVSKGNKPPICFFPSYFCNVSLYPLRQSGAKIVFYRITKDLEPDWEDVRRRAIIEPPDLFVLVHYFGRYIDNSEAFVFAKKMECVVLEDAAHVMIPHKEMGKDGSIVLFSPHKMLPLPPISVLSVPDFLNEKFQKYLYPKAWRKEDLKWLINRFIQKGAIITKLSVLKKNNFVRPIGQDVLKPVKPLTENYPCTSPLGTHLISKFQEDLLLYAEGQRDTAKFIIDAIEDFSDKDSSKLYYKWLQDSIPYTLPLFIKSSKIDDLRNFLNARGVLANTWPDLPPEVVDLKSFYENAWYWRNHILFFTVHISLTSPYIDNLIGSLRDFFLNESLK